MPMAVWSPENMQRIYDETTIQPEDIRWLVQEMSRRKQGAWPPDFELTVHVLSEPYTDTVRSV